MTPDPSQWRVAANYDHVDELSASDLAWEWLRRNDEYDRDFAAIQKSQALARGLESFRLRWGLRFPGGPAATSFIRLHCVVTGGGHKHSHPNDRTTASRSCARRDDILASAPPFL